MKRYTATLVVCLVAGAQAGVAISSIAEARTLQSDPEGSYMALRGPISVAGRAPLPMDELPEGDYALSADGPGLPAVRGRCYLDESGAMKLRPWAGPGALLTPPGLIHLDRGEKRGWIFLGGTAASAAFASSAHSAFRDAEDDVERAEAEYARAVSEEALDDARTDLLIATRDRDDQAEIRDLWIAYAATTWIAAGVEAWLLTPQPSLAATDGGYRVGLPRAGSWGAAWRSTLVPGAGQRYMGHPGRANLFGAAVALGAGATILAHEEFLEARRDQARAQAALDQAETEAELERARADLRSAADDTDKKDLTRSVIAGVTAGVYVWNIFDAFRAGGDPGGSGLSWVVAPSADGLLAAASWSLR